MAELKHTFTSGRMNKDLDERLVPNGEYIDALNVQVSSSEGSDVGAVENLLGNIKVSNLNLPNARVIGATTYGIDDKIFFFATSDVLDGIYEIEGNKTNPILIDRKTTNTVQLQGIVVSSNLEGEFVVELISESSLASIIGNDVPKIEDEEKLVLNNIDISSSNFIISIPKNTVLKKDGNGHFVFKNIKYNNKKYGNIDAVAEYTGGGILNFSKNNLITGINVIDDLLFWTDNLNQPRRININEFKKNTNGVIDEDTQIEFAIKDNTTGSSTVVKLKRPFNEDDISVIKKAPMYAPSLGLFDTVSDGIVDIKYTFDLSNVYVGEILKLENLSSYPSWKVGDFVNVSSVDVDSSIECSVKSVSDTLIELNVVTISGEFDASYEFDIELKEKKALYELNFVRFAYRWKYKNGEYSVMSPFTEPAFIPDEFKYDGKEAFNYGMINQLQRVVLSNFDLGNDDIEEVDILFKEGRNQNIYALQTKKKIDFTGVFEITKEQIHSVVPNDQLLRQWDNVPKRAKAQEVTANRVIYGNYTQNYDVYNEPDMTISVEQRDDLFKRTIKSNRTYQLGVTYIDDYNRHTPVLSNDTGTYTLDKSNSTIRNKFSIKLNNQAPAWAKHFKYYVKDVSGEYYNLSADRFYQDSENGFTYVSFPSSDRNKVTEENYLLLKKKHGSNDPINEIDNRYKIINIFSDPPEFITSRKKVVFSIGDVLFTDDYSGSGGGNTITNKNQTSVENSSPIKDYATVQIKKANGSSDGVPIDDANEIKPGRFIQFAYGSKTSDIYEIKSIQQHPEGDNEIKITVTEPFDDDVDVIYGKVAPFNLGDASTQAGVSINIYETYTAAGDKEFDGRFFIKLKTNSVLSNSIIKEEIGGKSYLAKDGIPLNGVFAEQYDPGSRSNTGFNNVARYKKSATSDPLIPFIVSQGGSPSGSKTIGTIKYNITLEQATHNSDTQFDQVAKRIKVGDFVRFKNPDGTLHHDTVYEVGSKAITERKQTSWSGKTFLDKDRVIKELSLYFIDIDTADSKPLESKVVTKGDNTYDEEIVMEILEELNEEKIIIKDPAIFETEPLEQKTELNIYYETEKAIPIAEHDQTHVIEWYNAFAFDNGVESNRIRDDFNAIFVDSGVKASTVLAEPFKEEHKFNGIIWSGIINSRSGTNQSNQFNMANAITKDVLPSYGSIQKFFARDSDLVIYCEDKVIRALADKDILYNADGSSNLTASNRVIGNVIPFAGEYGISTNPESFAYNGFRAYHTDSKRGVVLRLSMDGLTPISNANMNGFFEDRLYNSGQYIIGSFDNRNKLYNLSFENLDTVCFDERIGGWVTRKSYLPEYALSLNDRYFTCLNGDIWEHDIEIVPRNNFYGQQYTTKIVLDVNDNPSVVKKYKTLAYEGTSGWKADMFTDQQKSSKLTFKDKENKYFSNITGEAKSLDNIDIKNFSAQGIGKSVRKTTIPISNLAIVKGVNGEIIVINGGGGIGSLGSDFIISGIGLNISNNDTGGLNITGGNINTTTGNGNTTGGVGLGNTDTGGDIFNGNLDILDNGNGGLGNVDTTGGSGGVGTVNQDTDYGDQLGAINNTTSTFSISNISQSAGPYGVKSVDITKNPGEKINQVTFTIYPNNGYYILASDFTSSDAFTFTQSGDNVTAILSPDLTQPTSDTMYQYNVNGVERKKPVSVSGSFSLTLDNASSSSQSSGTFVRQGDYGEEKIIIERIITANTGYTISKNDIKSNNSLVTLQKIQISNTAVKVIESVYIPQNNTTNLNYIVTATAKIVVIADKFLVSKSVSTSGISNDGENRSITVRGEQNAKFKFLLEDTNGIIISETIELDSSGKKIIDMQFPAGSAAETYTMSISNLSGTQFDNNFGAKTIVFSRPSKVRKTAAFLVNYSNTINENFLLEDYVGESTTRSFSISLTLPSGTYTIGKQPSTQDISFGTNNNGASISLNNISFSSNVLTVSGNLSINSFQDNETYVLDVFAFVGVNVTTTFNFSKTSQNSNTLGNYTFTPAAGTNTVTGGAGLLSNPSDAEYFFTLTPSSSYSFKTSIDADDFEILSSSNVDVASIYCLSDQLLLRKVGTKLEIGFKTKEFNQPTASSTFTIRPKNTITITETTPTATIPTFSFNLKAYVAKDGVSPVYPTTQSSGYIPNLPVTGNKLHQLTLSAQTGVFDTSEISNNNLFYINNTNSTHIALATAGTYGSITIAGPWEISLDKKTLVVNLLINLGGSSALTSGSVDIYANYSTKKAVDANNNIVDKFYLIEAKLADCVHAVGGKDENILQWSSVNDTENRWPKYYSDTKTLSNNSRFYLRPSQFIAAPGNLASTVSLIQKNNPNLFSVETRYNGNILTHGWVVDKGICTFNTNNLTLSYKSDGVPATKIKDKYYYDIVESSTPVYSNLYSDEKVILTGSYDFDNISNYESVLQQLVDSGNPTVKPIQGVTLNDDGTFSKEVYFDKDGNASIDFSMFRGAKDYSVDLKFDDLSGDNNVDKITAKSYPMVRLADTGEDTFSYIDANDLDGYEIKKEYKQGIELNRFSLGNLFDSTSTRKTNAISPSDVASYNLNTFSLYDALFTDHTDAFTSSNDSSLVDLFTSVPVEVVKFDNYFYDALTNQGSVAMNKMGSRVSFRMNQLDAITYGKINEFTTHTAQSVIFPINLLKGGLNPTGVDTSNIQEYFGSSAIDFDGGHGMPHQSFNNNTHISSYIVSNSPGDNMYQIKTNTRKSSTSIEFDFYFFHPVVRQDKAYTNNYWKQDENVDKLHNIRIQLPFVVYSNNTYAATINAALFDQYISPRRGLVLLDGQSSNGTLVGNKILLEASKTPNASSFNQWRSTF